MNFFYSFFGSLLYAMPFISSNALASINYIVSNQIENQIDSLMTDYSGKLPGASILVARDGKVLFKKSYGMANVSTKRQVTSNTNFRLASVSKQFTAMAVMILNEERRLPNGFDTHLIVALPEFNKPGAPGFAMASRITVRHLLNHTSGLKDYKDYSLRPTEGRSQVTDRDVANYLSVLRRQDFATPADQAFRYSNPGYALLAVIVERLNGQQLSFAEFVKEKIFRPLQMDHSVVLVNGVNSVENRAYGYTVNGGSVSMTDQAAFTQVLGDGGVYTSVEDYFKWDLALAKGKLVSAKSMQAAFSGGKFSYGFGWRVGSVGGSPIVHHSGHTYGFRNFSLRFRRQHFTVIVLTNRRGSGRNPKEIAYRITQLLQKY